MIPVILIGKDEKQIKSYIDDFISKNKFKAGDIFKIEPEEKEITIDQIRELKKSVRYVSKARLFIIYKFDSASQEVQNALLKTLEEKTQNQFFLTAENSEKILSTIKSRSKIIYIKTDKKDVVSQKIKVLVNQIKTLNGYSFLNNPIIEKINREDSLNLIRGLILHYKENILLDNIAAKVLPELFKTYELINNNNINPHLAVDNLLIFIFKLYTINNKNEKRVYSN